MTDYVSVHIVASDAGEAERIATMLIEDRLAACVNILPPMRSIYRWDGKIKQAQEVLLIAKTRQSLFAALSARVTALHSYDCPCVVVFPIAAGHEPYLDWIAAETRAEPPG